MKSRTLAFLSAAVASAALSLPTVASAAASQLDSYEKSLNKRVTDFPKLRHGVCVCVGGDLDGRAGLIGHGVITVGGEVSFTAACLAQAFNQNTGALADTDVCDETWISLPE